jgi:hypothetical protein
MCIRKIPDQSHSTHASREPPRRHAPEATRRPPSVRLSLGVLAFGMLGACVSSSPHRASGQELLAIAPRDFAWHEVRLPQLQPGLNVAFLKGSFTDRGPLVFLFSMPAHYQLPMHFHDSDEDLIVLSGSLYIGGMDGRALGKASGILHHKGDTHRLPGKMTHWALTTNEAVVVEVHSEGPYQMHWVN